jgi:hypothetical protein
MRLVRRRGKGIWEKRCGGCGSRFLIFLNILPQAAINLERGIA